MNHETPISEIYLDMDDVLNTCGLSIFELFRVGGEPFDTKFGYNIVGMVNHIKRQRQRDPEAYEPISVPDFWDSIPGKFWGAIPKTEYCDALVDRCISCVGAENVFIATTPTKCSQQMAQKYEWIVEHLPKELHRNFFITPRKWKLGKPGALLIDDKTENVDFFRREGGRGIVHPQPWNINHNFYPRNFEYTMGVLEDIFGATQ